MTGRSLVEVMYPLMAYAMFTVLLGIMSTMPGASFPGWSLWVWVFIGYAVMIGWPMYLILVEPRIEHVWKDGDKDE